MRALTHFTRRVLSVGASAALLSSCGGFSAAVTPGDRNEALQPEAGQKTFYYTGHAERFVVPSGVTTIEVDAIGAAGGGIRYPEYCYGPCFGRGGRIEAEIPVRPGETLYVRVGGKGLRAPSGDAGGFNGGGTGGNGGYWGGNGGGGASDVREGGDKLKDRILVAGGGGAEGTGHLSFQCCNGGDGGGTVGGDGGFGSMKGGGGSGGSQLKAAGAARATWAMAATRDNQELTDLTVPSGPADPAGQADKAEVSAPEVAAAVAAAVTTAEAAVVAALARMGSLNPAAVGAAARPTSSRRLLTLRLGKAGSPLSTTAVSSSAGRAA